MKSKKIKLTSLFILATSAIIVPVVTVVSCSSQTINETLTKDKKDIISDNNKDKDKTSDNKNVISDKLIKDAMDKISSLKQIKPINDILSSSINQDNLQYYFTIASLDYSGVTISLSLGNNPYDDEKGILTITITGTYDGFSESKLIKIEGFLTTSQYNNANKKIVQEYINNLYTLGKQHTINYINPNFPYNGSNNFSLTAPEAANNIKSKGFNYFMTIVSGFPKPIDNMDVVIKVSSDYDGCLKYNLEVSFGGFTETTTKTFWSTGFIVYQ